MVFEYVGRKSLLGSNLENLDQSELKETSHSKLQKLDVSNCEFGGRGLLTFFRQISSSKTLKHLICDDNHLTQISGLQDRFSNYIGQSIGHNGSIVSLSLKNCEINDDLASSISYGLSLNTNLEFVNLSKNSITC